MKLVKKIYFNNSSDYEDSEESDSDDEAKNDTCESVTEENEIRAVCYECGEYRILCCFVFIRFI